MPTPCCGSTCAASRCRSCATSPTPRRWRRTARKKHWCASTSGWRSARPEAFHAWARRIAANAAIDELRRQKRLVPLAEEDDYDSAPGTRGAGAVGGAMRAPEPAAEAGGPDQADLAELRALLRRAPISARSCRVVTGRYLDNLPDEALAEAESRQSGGNVLPSHVQVTRTKDIARLRQWEPLRTFLKPPEA